MSNKLAIGLPIVLLCMMAFIGWRWDQARKAALVAQDQLAAVELERAGLQKALSVKPTEVVKFVDKLVPVEVVKLVEKNLVVPVTSIKIETKEVPVIVPCGDDGVAHTSVKVTGGFFLGTTPLGKPYWNRQLFVHLKGVDNPIDFSEDPGIELAVSDKISKLIAEAAQQPSRWRFTPRPLRAWRTGLTLGAGLCQPVLPLDRPNLCVGFLWGVQM